MKTKFFYVLPFIILISSCGGGGGSSTVDPIISINPIIDTFTSSASSISEGDSITLSWTTTNTITCSGSGSWNGNRAQSGTESFTLLEAGAYSYILTCTGENPQNIVSATVNINVSESDNYSDIYDEDKDSYCSSPLNDSSSYFFEEFISDTLNDEVFTYQESNGFCTIPGCPNGDDDYVPGWGNNEAQYYTSCREGYSKNCNIDKNTTENAFIEDGYLKIQPIFNNSQPFEDPYCSSGSCSYTWDYTSARIMTSTKKIISPGSEITICFKLPQGSGHWPAIWMLPQGFVEGQKTWPKDGENDLVEHMQHNQAFETQSTIHFGSPGNANNLSKIESVPADVDFYDKFHSVTMKWYTDKIEYFLDTQTEPYFSIEKNNESIFNNYYWPFNENFYLIINVATGGTAGGTPDRSMYCHDADCTNLDNKDKGRMLIDYIEIKSID
jgi:hypothetical protein